MQIEKVAVFSASARPGLAQVRQLKLAGYRVRAITRQKLRNTTLDGTEIVAADLNDHESLVAACRGVDAVFFTSPTFTERGKAVVHSAALGAAAREAGVPRLVYNTTSWHPDHPIGVPTMDTGYAKTKAFFDSGARMTVVRPSLFMDNLLTKWVKPYLLRDHEFAYPHNLDLDVSWICLDDVARFMIETAKRDEYEGEIIDIGGPQTLRPTAVAELLGEALGYPVTYRQITPREFGERMWEVFKDVSGQTREAYVDNLERHYLFKNDANPFYVPMEAMLQRIPVPLTPMREWLKMQDWSENPVEEVGSVSA
jgi:uncharacterized protein YbjT (DUF2867 family)